MFDHAAVANLGAHLGLEEAIDVAAFLLGAIERHVGMVEQRLAIGRVVGAERDADAGGDRDFRRIGRRREALNNGLGEPAGRRGAGNVGQQDGELVAAEPRHHLPVVQQGTDARGNGLQSPVAGGVSEQIVDLLEAVEIEAEHRRGSCRARSPRSPDRRAR